MASSAQPLSQTIIGRSSSLNNGYIEKRTSLKLSKNEAAFILSGPTVYG
jgi:hypothetical protein